MLIFRQKQWQRRAAWLAIAALTIQPQLLTAAPTASVGQPMVDVIPSDIALADEGALSGQLLNNEGTPLALAPVSLQTASGEVVRVHTDAAGNFRVPSLKGGVYQVASKGHQGVYRFWAPGTAPPAAAEGLTIVSGTEVVRGQYAPSSTGPLVSAGQWIAQHPIITGGVIAAAIVIPLALANDDDDDSPPATP